ncbi:MAG TPA: bifunctional phosphopantothenoylcysteine decarboxylase/phosphopantothenate--cysteine ligase CoaBC [Opitutaceae bacterium]|nr:bifunctional phosphopantothenoylcysteine decarboxylase/phosphopantothenate--cysteine ligase CoaBC [Opitutaceae bacterium]
MSGSNLLFIVSGSIAAYKACDAVSQLVQRGHHVRVVMTKSAGNFVGEATLEGLTGERVLTDLFSAGDALAHIEWARWADAVVVCPATAHTLNRFAAGLADDLAGALFLAHDRTKPYLVAPAMNPEMWRHPATAAAVERLRGWGVRFIPVGEGRTACGETGEGRLAEPGEIVAAIEATLAARAGRRRILVTSGGTAEPIDGVRVLTNLSTGHTGARLAEHFARHGHEVVLLRSRLAESAGNSCREETFLSFADLDAALTRLLGSEHFDVVLHAAAVSDFGVEAVLVDGAEWQPGKGKLDSDTAPLLRLRRNPKLIGSLRARSRNPGLRLVAFKLTSGADEAAIRAEVQSLFDRTAADLVVHNDFSTRASPDAFPSAIYRPGDAQPVPCATRGELAEELTHLLSTDTATVPPT